MTEHSWRARCAVWLTCLQAVWAYTAMAGPSEFHRELLASWKALEDGFTYEMSFEREPLVIVKTAGEGAGRRLVGFAPAPAGLGERGRLLVTGAGETLHVVRLDEQESGGFLFREDSIYGVDSEGRRLNRLARSTSSEFNSISFFGFVFSPDYVSRHWLGQPWPEAWIHPGTAPTYKVTEKPADKPDQRVFEVTMVARAEGVPDVVQYLTTRYERFGGPALWVPTFIEQQSADRQTMKRVVLEWVEVGAGGKVVAVPKRFLFDSSARNPADGQFVPANRYTVVLDESTFRVRSRGADAGVFGVLDAEPPPAMIPSEPLTLDTNRIYMIIFVCAVIAAAVLIGVRRLKKT